MECNKNTYKNYKINIMLYSDGASSHILAEKILSSSHINKFFIAGHNSFVKKMGIPVDIDDLNLISFAKENDVELFICDSEINSNGITSAFLKAGIPSLGVTKKWTRLESSKVFGKKFASDFSIPTPQYCVFSNYTEYVNSISELSFPFVVKIDGYSKGLGAYIVENADDLKFVNEQLYSLFADNLEVSQNILVEEFLKGDELSYITVWNGHSLVPICFIKDYKKLNTDSKINTSSMGAYFSLSLVDNLKQKMLSDYHKRLETALVKLKPDFTGPIYSGLIFSKDKYQVLEFNMRFGTTESAIIFSNLNVDFVEFALTLVKGEIQKSPFDFKKNVTTVVLYNSGYPSTKDFQAKIPISTIEKIVKDSACKIKVYYNKVSFHEKYCILNSDASIYLVTTEDPSYIYAILKDIKLDNIQYRTDIGL